VRARNCTWPSGRRVGSPRVEGRKFGTCRVRGSGRAERRGVGRHRTARGHVLRFGVHARAYAQQGRSEGLKAGRVARVVGITTNALVVPLGMPRSCAITHVEDYGRIVRAPRAGCRGRVISAYQWPELDIIVLGLRPRVRVVDLEQKVHVVQRGRLSDIFGDADWEWLERRQRALDAPEAEHAQAHAVVRRARARRRLRTVVWRDPQPGEEQGPG